MIQGLSQEVDKQSSQVERYFHFNFSTFILSKMPAIRNSFKIGKLVPYEDWHIKPSRSLTKRTTYNYEAQQVEFKNYCRKNNLNNIVTSLKLYDFITKVVIPTLSDSTKPVNIREIKLNVDAIVALQKHQESFGINSHGDPRNDQINHLLENYGIKNLKEKDEEIEISEDSELGEYSMAEFQQTMYKSLTKYAKSTLRSRLTFILSHLTLFDASSIRSIDLSGISIHLIPDTTDSTPLKVISFISGKDRENNNAVARHKDLEMCSVYALALWLFYRFQVSNEGFPNMLDGETWKSKELFIKLFNMGRRPNLSDNQSFKRGARRAQTLQLSDLYSGLNFNLTNQYISQGIGSHFLHLGGVSPLELDKLEDWRMQPVLDFSTIPQATIRFFAGFPTTPGTYYIPRSRVIPSDKLLEQVFPEIEENLSRLDEQPSSASQKEVAFLMMLKELRIVLLQDTAVLSKKYPSHHILQHSLFKSDEFIEFAQSMEESLSRTLESETTLIVSPDSSTEKSLKTPFEVSDETSSDIFKVAFSEVTIVSEKNQETLEKLFQTELAPQTELPSASEKLCQVEAELMEVKTESTLLKAQLLKVNAETKSTTAELAQLKAGVKILWDIIKENVVNKSQTELAVVRATSETQNQDWDQSQEGNLHSSMSKSDHFLANSEVSPSNFRNKDQQTSENPVQRGLSLKGPQKSLTLIQRLWQMREIKSPQKSPQPQNQGPERQCLNFEVAKFIFNPSVTSVEDLWTEWYEGTSSKPSVVSLDYIYGSSWRRKKPKITRQYECFSRIIDEVNDTINNYGFSRRKVFDRIERERIKIHTGGKGSLGLFLFSESLLAFRQKGRGNMVRYLSD